MSSFAAIRGFVLVAGAALAAATSHATLIYGSGRLNAEVLRATCSTTSPEGETTSAACSPAGWSPTLEPGSSALMVATIGYHYADEGRRLSSPASIQVSDRGSVMASFESAVLYGITSADSCGVFQGGVHCSTDIVPFDAYIDVDAQFPLFLSNNDHAESVSGELTVSTGWQWDPPADFPFSPGATMAPTLFVDVWGIAHAVPEPGTWVLMAWSLLGLVVAAHRRRRVQD
jgi:MYXO-CTERM domain-containing protein